jgi:hypothetical protein
VANRILFDFVEGHVGVVSEKGKKDPAGSKPVDIPSASKPIEGVGTAVAAFVGPPLLVRHLEPLADGTWLALGLGSNTIPADPPGEAAWGLLVGVVAPASAPRSGAAHRFSLRVLDPDGGLIAEELEILVNLTSGSRVTDDWELTAQLPTLVRMPVETPGAYRAEMRFDDATCSHAVVVSEPDV